MTLKHDSSPSAEESLTKLSPGKTKNILYIDSDVISHILVSIILSKKNYKLSYVRSGLEGIQLIKQNASFDLVITELRLPDMEGLDILSEIRKIAPTIPVIGLAFSLHDIRCQCSDNEFDHIIEKPIDIELFATKVEKLIHPERSNKNNP